MNRIWLTGYCKAKRMPLPPKGVMRTHRPKYEDAPVPPPLVSLTNEELHDLIWENMGLKAAARILQVHEYHLSVYCLVHKIETPTRRTFARERYKTTSVFLSPVDEVRQLLSQTDNYREVAKHYKILPDKLVRYCQRNKLEIPGYAYRERRGQYSIKFEEPASPKLAPAPPANPEAKAA